MPVTATALPAETPALEPITLEFEDLGGHRPDGGVQGSLLAKMVWGEARGCSTTEQAATIWVRAEPLRQWGDRFWADTVEGITTQPCQFYSYDPSNPVDPDILALVEDVLARWMAEKECVGSVPGAAEGVPVLHPRRRTQLLTTDGKVGRTWDWSTPWKASIGGEQLIWS